MNFGLKDAMINSIHKVFESSPEIEKAVIYGSRAKGNYKQGSDIDICLFGSMLSSNLINKLSTELDDLMLPYTFDLTIYDKLSNPELKDHIERIGKIFYQRI